MRKVLLSVAAFLAVAALGAYQNQTQILLALVKYQSAKNTRSVLHAIFLGIKGPMRPLLLLQSVHPILFLSSLMIWATTTSLLLAEAWLMARQDPHIDQLAADGVVLPVLLWRRHLRPVACHANDGSLSDTNGI